MQKGTKKITRKLDPVLDPICVSPCISPAEKEASDSQIHHVPRKSSAANGLID